MILALPGIDQEAFEAEGTKGGSRKIDLISGKGPKKVEGEVGKQTERGRECRRAWRSSISSAGS